MDGENPTRLEECTTPKKPCAVDRIESHTVNKINWLVCVVFMKSKNVVVTLDKSIV